MHFNTNLNKFKSITYGYSNQITVLSNEDFDGISIFTLRNQQFSNNPISVALIYRSPNSPLTGFIDCLRYLVGRSIDILLGDINIYAFDKLSYARLKEVLCNYNLKVSEPTHLDGALLDHVYLSKSFEYGKYVTPVVSNIYFSDHDAIKAQFRFRQNLQEDIDFNMSV